MLDMLFDFSGYLEQLDPLQSYQITQLTGGVINVTVRATKASQSTIHSGKFPGHESVVLKYAPPFVAGVGPEANLTQTRQVTEATILSFFDGPLEYIKRQTNVAVPNLLHHDPQHHVVVMSDLGRIPNLSEIFSTLGGYTPNETAEILVWTTDFRKDGGQMERPNIYFSTLGRRLGTFFAHLHAQKTLRKISLSADAVGFQLSNPGLSDSVYAFAIKPLEARLELFVDLIPAPESALTLYERIERNWLRPICDSERSFTLGDCWTGAILVSPPVLRGSPVGMADPDVGVIDWEFATISRGPHGDIPQFLAHLESLRHAAIWRNSSFHIRALDTIISSLISAYKAISREQHGVWIHSDRNISTERPKSMPDSASLGARIVRSALLALASEILNCAFWKVWPCLEPSCPALLSNKPAINTANPMSSETNVHRSKTKRRPSFQTYSSPPSAPEKHSDLQQTNEESIPDEPAFLHDEELVHVCPLVRQMGESAIWLTCRAGKSEVDMCQISNWEELIGGLPALTNHHSDRHHTLSDEALNERIHDGEGQSAVDVRRNASQGLTNDELVGKRMWLLDLFT